ncbi:MAG: hypothetical protein KJ736_03515 [Candidatus Omnitrophica bacterium]|nr:hypothetical protein [Candidatus Omnitrophota bacterium]
MRRKPSSSLSLKPEFKPITAGRFGTMIMFIVTGINQSISMLYSGFCALFVFLNWF